MPFPRAEDSGHESKALQRRHRFYLQLLLICLLLLGTFTLTLSLKLLITVGYTVMVLLLVVQLGRPVAALFRNRFRNLGYRALGIAAITSHCIWLFTPLSHQSTGISMLLLWTLFLASSTLRLLEMLGQESVVNLKVLMGAVAGYLMLGLTAGLLLSGLETLHPGSFSGVSQAGGELMGTPDGGGLFSGKVWVDRFVRLNYFSFVTLTTTGYGDILAVSRPAMIATLLISVIGTIYIAVVLGLFISRYTGSQKGRKAEKDCDR